MDFLRNYHGWYKACLDVLFPPACVVCRQPMACGAAAFLCSSCVQSVHYIQSPLCICCGKEFLPNAGGDRLCGLCLTRMPPFGGARALTLYTPPVSTLLHRLKYNGDAIALQILSELAKRFDFTFFRECDCIIPVPLHRRRLQVRGLNQSLLLARVFFPDASALIVPDVLVRVRDTRPQTGLGHAERKGNLRSAFAVKKRIDVRGRKICLVDDVLTTGTTVEECCKILLMAGAAEVKVVTMARVAAQFVG